jgi:outer membrane protein OmpA-like peptidoglycan-associated protein
MAYVMRAQISPFFLVMSLLLCIQGSAQNLVKNGSFEELLECPKEVSSLAKNAFHLSSPTNGTTDIFSTCSKGKVAAPKNFRGNQEPLSGDAYAGLYLYSPNDYREYIQLPLNTVLKKGAYYEFSLFVSLAESSTVSTSNLNVLFTDQPITVNTSKNLSKSRLLRDKNHKFNFQKLSWKGSSRAVDDWVKVEIGFEAKGFEKNIVLGNFDGDEVTTKFKTKSKGAVTKEFAYYYIDDVTLIKNRHHMYELGAPYVIEGVRFETDSYLLSELAKTKVRELYQRLQTMPKGKITINGHTDDMGSEGHNEFLSHKRAKAVATYLVQLGFPEDRIVWEGHGNRKPLVPKLTEEARLKNRRVDFVITDFEDDN